VYLTLENIDYNVLDNDWGGHGVVIGWSWGGHRYGGHRVVIDLKQFDID
jgi:hypothetical protein